MTDTDLTNKALGIARTLSYNDQTGPAKHMLRELAHRLDSQTIYAHKKRDGLLLVNARGKARYATWREHLAYRIAGTLPREI